MAPKTEAYVDTSAVIALLDRSDSYHSLFRTLFATPPQLTTSALVIAEGHGWFLRRYDRNRAIQFLNFVADLSLLQIQALDDDALSEAGGLIRKFHDQPLTLADAHGLAIMAQRRLSVCWSTDRHLAITGATLVVERTH
jgi:predicted nucleic acid-binding protein